MNKIILIVTVLVQDHLLGVHAHVLANIKRFLMNIANL